MTRLDRRFAELRSEGRTALVAYLTIGDPSPADSLACARAAIAAGADILELGVPFSDPTADGPVIAAASHRAIRQGGSLRAALEVAEALRRDHDAPLVLFSYVNPLLAYGETRLVTACARIGIDALLVVDLPPEEGEGLRSAARDAGIAIVPLVAPTTSPERLPSVLERASGFVYYVSVTGVTGSGEAPLTEAGIAARSVARACGLPVVVGFGIDTPAKARQVADSGVDGVVVGTAIVKAIAGATDEAGRTAAVARLVTRLRSGLDAPARQVP